MDSNIDTAILNILAVHEVSGIRYLSTKVLGCNNVHYVRNRIRMLSANGLISVDYDKPPSGRGHKARIKAIP